MSVLFHPFRMHPMSNELSRECRHLLDGFARSSEHVTVTDRDGKILFANEAAVTHTGFSMDDMLGKKPGELWGGHMPTEFYAHMWETLLVQKQAYIGEMHNRRKNGAMYWQQVHIIPVLEERGAVQYFIGIELSVDAQQKHEDLMQNTASVDAAGAIKVRWPLGWLLEKGHLSRQELLDLQQQYADNDALDALVDDLLALSSVHRADQEPVEEFSLPILLSAVMEEVRQRFPDRRYVLEDSDASVSLCEKQRLLRIALDRIITNAAEYASAANGEVRLSVLVSDDQCIIRCQDNGIGLSLQEQRHLFEKFYRGTRARALHPAGSGLGLFLAHSIAEARGWTIACISEPDRGARFDLTIPLQDV